jgi:hypothetical protein
VREPGDEFWTFKATFVGDPLLRIAFTAEGLGLGGWCVGEEEAALKSCDFCPTGVPIDSGESVIIENLSLARL